MTIYPTPRSKPPTVHDAIAIAAAAHHGQVDKAGQPYLFHPISVASRFKDPTAQIVAVLHDIVEDTELSLSDLRNFGFDDEVLTAVDCLTHRDGESYDAYLARVASDDLATSVKYADIDDNSSGDRLRRLSDPERSRLGVKYHSARVALGVHLAARWRAENDAIAAGIDEM